MTREPDGSTDPHAPLPVHPGERSADFEESSSLVELVNRVLDRGVVLQGDVTISVAGVDLIYLGLNALLTSISTARRTLQRPVGGSFLPDKLRVPPRSAGTSLAAAVGSLQPPAAIPLARAPHTPEGEATASAEPLQAELVQLVEGLPERLEVDPDAVQRDLARLVLTLVELLRRVVEHQAVRRMEDGDLSEAQVERMGTALLRLEEKLAEIKRVFGVADDELNIDLGPLGKLL